MEPIGYITAVVLAALLAAAGNYLIDRKFTLGRGAYMFVLAFLGLWGGARLFGEIGSISSLSEQGPAIGGFYVITGLIGGLIMTAVGVLGLRRAVVGKSTDIADAGIHDPKIAHLLFNDTRSAPLWLGLRLYIGYEWLAAGWHKVTDPAWMDGGQALAGYWTRVTAIPEQGNPPIVYGWYRDLLAYMLNNEWHTWFAKLVAVGEVLVGAALIVGVVVGIAAFFGTLMNFSFMLAGSASTNPVLFGLGVFLVLAWKVAGYWGLDRVLLPMLGTPWSPGKVFKGTAEGKQASPA